MIYQDVSTQAEMVIYKWMGILGIINIKIMQLGDVMQGFILGHNTRRLRQVKTE